MNKISNYTVIFILFLSLSVIEAAILMPSLKENNKVILKLEKDEVAIFSYGSLMQIEELHDQSYNGPFIQADLANFKRTWSARYPTNWRHQHLKFKDKENEYFFPKSITYLNIEPCKDCKVNGMIFVCSKKDLEYYDKREAPYNRVKINDKLLNISIIGGDTYVYTAKPKQYFPTNKNTSPRDTVILQSYVDIIEEALNILGKEFTKEYNNSTQPLPTHLVF